MQKSNKHLSLFKHFGRYSFKKPNGYLACIRYLQGIMTKILFTYLTFLLICSSCQTEKRSLSDEIKTDKTIQLELTYQENLEKRLECETNYNEYVLPYLTLVKNLNELTDNFINHQLTSPNLDYDLFVSDLNKFETKYHVIADSLTRSKNARLSPNDQTKILNTSFKVFPLTKDERINCINSIRTVLQRHSDNIVLCDVKSSHDPCESIKMPSRNNTYQKCGH